VREVEEERKRRVGIRLRLVALERLNQRVAVLQEESEELAAVGEFDVTLVNTSVDEVCRQMVTLIVSLVNP